MDWECGKLHSRIQDIGVTSKSNTRRSVEGVFLGKPVGPMQEEKIPTNITDVDMADALTALIMLMMLQFSLVGEEVLVIRQFAPPRLRPLEVFHCKKSFRKRRVVRLWENGLSKMSLIDIKDIGFVKIAAADVFQEMSNVLHIVEGLRNTEKGSYL